MAQAWHPRLGGEQADAGAVGSLMPEWRQYENGVADVFAFLLGDKATVERNVKLPGMLSKEPRQLDIVVRGRVLGRDEATLVVECKRWRSKLDVEDVGCFIDKIRDVGAKFGMLVTTVGATAGALERARAEPDLHVKIMPLDELQRWAPKGTMHTTYRLSAARQEKAEGAETRGLPGRAHQCLPSRRGRGCPRRLPPLRDGEPFG